uniref:Major facilitator superfamily associated domain-containing protein n=1 Tax=Ciona savignyi TaxID=51511 RepID=H2ZQJ8_CIOSA
MAIVQTITHGFGWSVGALLGGYMFEVMGGDLMFRTMALAVTVCAFLYSVLSFYFNKTTKKVVRTASPKTPPELMEMEELVTGN